MGITNQAIFWKRKGYVAIESRDGTMMPYGGEYEALDFRFNGEKIIDTNVSFSVGILGLSHDTIKDLTVWNPAKAVREKRKISVFAGYDKDNISVPIFTGYIFNAMPTIPPNMWLNFQCLCDEQGMGTRIPEEDKNKSGITKQGLIEFLAEKMGISSKWKSEVSRGDEEISQFVCEDNVRASIKKFQDMFNLKVYIEDGLLVVADANPEYGSPQSPIEVSMDTGMIEIPKVNVAGATIKMRLNPAIKRGDWIKLSSELIPSANGNYIVVRVTHSGHYRGNEWFTEIETIRQQGRGGK